MRFLLLFLVFGLAFSPAYAVTGDDVGPGSPCSVNKAMMMTANPSGVGGYILTCESGTWRATLTAELPTLPDQVATKRYIDESVATIETQTYTHPTWYTTTGEALPILVTGLVAGAKARVAAFLCSSLSDGNYVQGKFVTLRNISNGYARSSDGSRYNCAGSCITGPSGKKYAWFENGDFQASGFYLNAAPPYYNLAGNAGVVTTQKCSSWAAGDAGTVTVNAECMAGATSTRTSLSGLANPAYQAWSSEIEEIICWSN